MNQQTDKLKAIKSLDKLTRRFEEGYTPKPFLNEFMVQEQKEAWKYGGRTAKGFSKPPNDQLNLFD